MAEIVGFVPRVAEEHKLAQATLKAEASAMRRHSSLVRAYVHNPRLARSANFGARLGRSWCNAQRPGSQCEVGKHR